MTAAFAGAPNPGDTGNESVNAFNKRENVPTSEVTYIQDHDDLPGPPNGPVEGMGSISSNDAHVGVPGNEDWKAPAYFREEARRSDNEEAHIVAVPAE